MMRAVILIFTILSILSFGSGEMLGMEPNKITIETIRNLSGSELDGKVAEIVVSGVIDEDLEVVALITHKQEQGFFFPTWNGEVIKPKRVSDRKWMLKFNNNATFKSIYAISCRVDDVSLRSGWTVQRDYAGLKYLKFDHHKTIEESLSVLKDFGWQPTGYTHAPLQK